LQHPHSFCLLMGCFVFLFRFSQHFFGQGIPFLARGYFLHYIINTLLPNPTQKYLKFL
jgi:hypothetical protein